MSEGKMRKLFITMPMKSGRLVEEYNNMVDKLDESIVQLAKSERESAWREMARQIAHEIKNPTDSDEVEYPVYAAFFADGRYGEI